jgi:hypothetical protein
MPCSSGKTLCIAGWLTRKTATTNVSSASYQNAGSRLKMRLFPVYVTGRQACRLDSPGNRAMDPFIEESRCVEICAQESSNLNLKWFFKCNCILKHQVYESYNLCILYCVRGTFCSNSRLWNIMLPWNRVVTSSISLFQTSCEHMLVALTVCTWSALGLYVALIVAIVLLLLQ